MYSWYVRQENVRYFMGGINPLTTLINIVLGTPYQHFAFHLCYLDSYNFYPPPAPPSSIIGRLITLEDIFFYVKYLFEMRVISTQIQWVGEGRGLFP